MCVSSVIRYYFTKHVQYFTHLCHFLLWLRIYIILIFKLTAAVCSHRLYKTVSVAISIFAALSPKLTVMTVISDPTK